jgi:serine/threonine protein phosphatase PrpC
MLRNVILQAIGKTPEITVAMSRLELRRGDRLLLCTDGLTSMVADDELATIVSDPPSLDVGCARLIARAIGQGGRDNVTVILADVSGPEVPEAREDGELSDTFREDTTPQGPKC